MRLLCFTELYSISFLHLQKTPKWIYTSLLIFSRYAILVYCAKGQRVVEADYLL